MEYVLSAGDLDANNEAMEEILLFLRNMSFSQDMKTYLSSKNEALHGGEVGVRLACTDPSFGLCCLWERNSSSSFL